MIDFILSNIEAVGTALVAVILLVYAIITRQWGLVRTSALSLMLSAERLMTTKEGIEKMDWVLGEVWRKTPTWIKKVYTEDKLKEVLQKWYEDAKEMIA